MTNLALSFGMDNPELYSRMIQTAYEIMDYIDHLESIEHDGGNSHERRQAAATEKSFQMEDLEELKSLMKNSRSGFTRIIYYKYIEGFSLEEVALELGLSGNYVAMNHAAFTKYMKQPKEQFIPNKTADNEAYLRRLKGLVGPKYEECCTHCGSTTEISRDIVTKILTNETRRARAVARG